MPKYERINFFFLIYKKIESRTTNNAINAIKEVRELFNELSREETKRIRK